MRRNIVGKIVALVFAWLFWLAPARVQAGEQEGVLLMRVNPATGGEEISSAETRLAGVRTRVAEAAFLAVSLAGGRIERPASRFVQASGTRLIGSDGREVRLRGLSLGNWLLPEGTCSGREGGRAPAAPGSRRRRRSRQPG